MGKERTTVYLEREELEAIKQRGINISAWIRDQVSKLHSWGLDQDLKLLERSIRSRKDLERVKRWVERMERRLAS